MRVGQLADVQGFALAANDQSGSTMGLETNSYTNTCRSVGFNCSSGRFFRQQVSCSDRTDIHANKLVHETKTL